MKSLRMIIFILTLGITQLALSQTFTQITTGDIVNNGGWNYGCAWGDYDGDGNQDLFVVNNQTGAKNNFLYKNNGNGTFTKIISGIVVTDGGSSYGCTWGDYDNDGNLDLFVSNYNENNFLYHNNGSGSFTKITSGTIVNSGGSSTCPAWGDYDNDGYIDLFVCNRTQPNFLYHNNGDGTFTKITSGTIVTENKNSGACAWGDYDGDGHIDIYVANSGPDYSSLFHNEGNGTFTAVNTAPFNSDLQSFGSTSWGDYDNDGDLDLFAAPGMLPYNFDLYLYKNNSDGSFTRITGLPQAGINSGGGSGMVDYDNDGDLDIFLAAYDGNNILLQNDGAGNFTQITSGTLVVNGNYNKGTSWADYDKDGDIDLFIAVNNYFSGNNRLFMNNGNSNGWLGVNCKGVFSNKCGIGAVITVTANIGSQLVSQTRVISSQTGGGNSSQNSLIAHFGLGNATIIDSIVIKWPSGIIQKLTNIGINQLLTIIETPVLIKEKNSNLPTKFELLQNYPNPFNPYTTIEYKISKQTEVKIELFDNSGRKIQTLLNSRKYAGIHSVIIDGSELSSGIYYYQMITEEFQRTRKCILLK